MQETVKQLFVIRKINKMKIYIYIIVFLLIGKVAVAQEINFDSYDRIADNEFQSFVDLFEIKNLPLSTDDVFTQIDIRNLGKKSLNHEFLMDNGELITGALYNEKTDEGNSNHLIFGEFYPLYRLPTNGDYVLLVVAQIDPYITGYDKVFVLSFDLKGNFVYYASYLYQAGTEDINNYIDENLQVHDVYVVNEVNGEMVFPSLENEFTAKEAHLIYQINSDGKATRVSFDTNDANFKWSWDELRFKKLN